MKFCDMSKPVKLYYRLQKKNICAATVRPVVDSLLTHERMSICASNLHQTLSSNDCFQVEHSPFAIFVVVKELAKSIHFHQRVKICEYK